MKGMLLVCMVGVVYFAPMLPAEALSVSYLQGSAAVRADYLWSALSIGESVASDATLKLDGNSCLELSRARPLITLHEPGIYHLSKLVSQSKAMGLAVLTAKLLLDTYAFKEDVAWLTGPAAALAHDTRRAPTYYLLLGVSYRGLGEVDLAKKSLATAVRLGGNSDVARAAARLSRQI